MTLSVFFRKDRSALGAPSFSFNTVQLFFRGGMPIVINKKAFYATGLLSIISAIYQSTPKRSSSKPKLSCYFFFPFQLLPRILRQQINIQINKLQINILVHILIHLMGHLGFAGAKHDEWEIRCFVS